MPTAVSLLSFISSAASSLVSFVTGLVSAISSTISAVVGAVTGAIGAVSGIVSSIVSTISGAVSSVVSVVNSVISTITGIIGSIFSAITSVAGAIFGVLSGIVSGVVSAISSVIGAITSVISAVTSAFESVASSLGAVAGIAGQALSGFASVVQESVEALMSFASNVTSISNHSGMSVSAASNLTAELGSVGIAAGETAKIFGSIDMRPELFNMRSDSVGLANMSDPNFIANEATKYQALVKTVGLVEAQARLKAQFGGQIPESMLRMVNMDPKKLQANIDFDRQTRKELGVGDGQIKAASEDLPLLMDRVSQFVETLKIKFAADLLPSLQAGFSMVSKFLSANSGNISNILQTATRAIFVDGPGLAANAALTVIGWAEALSNAFFFIVDAGIGLLENFANGDGPIFAVLNTGAKFLDSLLEFGAQLAGVVVAIGAMIKNAIIRIGGAGLLRKLGIDTKIVDPKDAYNKTYKAFHRKESFSKQFTDLHTQNQQGMRTAVNNTRNLSNTKHATINAGFQNIRGEVDTIIAKSGTPQDREKQFADSINHKLDEVGNKIVGAVKDTNSKGLSAGQVLGRIGAYIAEDAYRLTSR